MSKDSISYSEINTRGGIGNQLYYYALAKKCSENLKCDLRTPKDWKLRNLFKMAFKDPWVEAGPKHPKLFEDEIPTKPNVDITGCYQYSHHVAQYSKSDCLRYFEMFDSYKKLFPYNPEEKYVAVHVRRGDYVGWCKDWSCTISSKSYEKILQRSNPNGYEIRWVYDPTVLDWKYSRYSSHDGRCKEFKWLSDFMLLVNSEILIRANSTFSLWAGVFHQGSQIYSPRIDNLSGLEVDVNFEPSNCCRVQCKNPDYYCRAFFKDPPLSDFNLRPN